MGPALQVGPAGAEQLGGAQPCALDEGAKPRQPLGRRRRCAALQVCLERPPRRWREGPRRRVVVAAHIEQTLAGIYALRPTYQAGLDFVSVDVERLRHLIWNGYAEEAGQALWALTHLASEAIYLNGEHLGPAVRRFLLHCQELRVYLANNEDALIDYGTRYRAGRPISSSRAEGSVAEIANARMGKRRRMCWSPRGAHCVASVRAAVLDGRLHDLTTMRFAA